ncbi:hypothetical protein PsorP6_017370 [Peronosclerospora sorghi]|uniref:Uncharacterized protein n=1 Tax=Peronosclerospora sorghi TaxID=230839 RepID=A0ACC0WNM8_9STRA|nr:hypothetical protein PsorP6_017370 [Peronosclerospora sorghi]
MNTKKSHLRYQNELVRSISSYDRAVSKLELGEEMEAVHQPSCPVSSNRAREKENVSDDGSNEERREDDQEKAKSASEDGVAVRTSTLDCGNYAEYKVQRGSEYDVEDDERYFSQSKLPHQKSVDTILVRIGEVKSAPRGLYGEVYIDNSTRVFAIGDTKVFLDVRQRALVNDWLSNTVIDCSMHGVGITLVDEQPQEILNITMETIRLSSKTQSRRVSLVVHHEQFDDMTPRSAYPVVFSPLDSGFNSDKREGWLPGDATVVQHGLEEKNEMLVLDVLFPDDTVFAGMLMYFKRGHMSNFDFNLVFDSLQEDKGEGISTILGTTMGSIVGGIAHVTPIFHFSEVVYQNRFFYEYDLIYDVVL